MKEVFRSDNPQRDWEEDFQHENGNYTCNCGKCENTFTGHKRRVVCKLCSYPINPNDPVLDFTDIFHYIKSVQKFTSMSDEEASTLYHLFDMWQKKRYFEPVEYKLM